MEIEYPLDGMAGFLSHMMMRPLRIATISITLSMRNRINGYSPSIPLLCIFQEEALSLRKLLNMQHTDKIDSQNHGNQQLRES
jgi:hypothetical protein